MEPAQMKPAAAVAALATVLLSDGEQTTSFMFLIRTQPSGKLSSNNGNVKCGLASYQHVTELGSNIARYVEAMPIHFGVVFPRLCILLTDLSSYFR